MKAISLAYHDVVDDSRVSPAGIRPGIGLYTLTRKGFRNHLQSIVEQSVFVRKIQSFGCWNSEVPVFLTFDDGAENAHSCIAGELEQRGWRGHFFITTSWIARSGFVNQHQIRELQNRGHVIGSHSHSHPARMSCLSWNKLIEEWSKSGAILSDILGEKVRVASVPDGYYSRIVAQAAAAAGFEVLFTSEATSVVSIVDDCLVLGRYFIQRHTPTTTSGAIAAEHIWPRLRQTALWEAKKLVKALTGTSYVAMRRYLLTRFMLQPNTPNCKPGPLQASSGRGPHRAEMSDRE